MGLPWKIHGGSLFLPEVTNLRILIALIDFSDNPQKDNFHKTILKLTNSTFFDI
jgi:hypothetical protein